MESIALQDLPEQSWLDHYRQCYWNLLDCAVSGAKRGLCEGIANRARGFEIMFELLLSCRTQDFDIVETGTCRNPGNWKDGQSAWLFTEFVKIHGGRVRSVDIDPDACQRARDHLATPPFQVTCGDSVEYLRSLDDLDRVDLFYLDSWDVKWNDDTPSAEHHLAEFLTIEPYLSAGTVVAIDDNARWLHNNQRTGKGRLVVEYLAAKHIYPVYDQYQIVYQY